MRDVPKQLKIIYDRSHVKEQVIAVFANKIELLNDESSGMSNSANESSLVVLQEQALTDLSKTIAKDFP